MKTSLLEKLRCLECGSGALSLHKKALENKMEILQGELVCVKCKASYMIKAGVLDMAPLNNSIIEKELQGNVVKSLERAADYDDSWLLSLPHTFNKEHGGEQFDHLNFIDLINSLNIGKNDTIVDLGCGTTWTSNELAKKSRNVIATDISLEKFIGLESARVFIDTYGNYYERVRTDMCKLPFKDGSVDFTINEASLHHAHDLGSSLKEISRVLKKAGKAVFINEPMSHLFDLRKPSQRHGFLEREKYGWNENKYTLTEYMKSLKKAGLKIDSIFYPESVRQKLFKMAVSKNENTGLKYRFGGIIAKPYSKSSLIRKIIENVLFYPVLAIGVPFCAIASKR